MIKIKQLLLIQLTGNFELVFLSNKFTTQNFKCNNNYKENYYFSYTLNYTNKKIAIF